MINKGHPDFHQFRDSPRGELGIINRTYLTSKDRAIEAEILQKAAQPDRLVWNEKR